MIQEADSDPPPSRLPWPPLLVVIVIVAGLACDRLSGGALSAYVMFPGAGLVGGVIVSLAFANDLWCAATLARHQTTILPHRASVRLVTDGSYSWSRNPIYVSHVALVLGLGLLLGSPFIIMLAPALALALQKLAIEPEERHLVRKFGDEYRPYMARTRRWL